MILFFAPRECISKVSIRFYGFRIIHVVIKYIPRYIHYYVFISKALLHCIYPLKNRQHLFLKYSRILQESFGSEAGNMKIIFLRRMPRRFHKLLRNIQNVTAAAPRLQVYTVHSPGSVLVSQISEGEQQKKAGRPTERGCPASFQNRRVEALTTVPPRPANAANLFQKMTENVIFHMNKKIYFCTLHLQIIIFAV